MVWVRKYRELVLKGGSAKRLKQVFQEIAERYEFEINTMEVKEDHVHLFFERAFSVFSLPDSANYKEHIG
jgi:putative transposase